MHILKTICFFLISFNFLFALEVSISEKSSFENAFKEFAKNLNNLELENPPLIISFSGAPGMGKTSLSKILEEKLKGVRISSDELRNLLKKYNIQIDLKKESHQNYLFYAMAYLSHLTKNHLIILDKSVDRDYASIADFAKKNHCPFFVIRLQLSKEETKKRLMTKENPDNYLKFLDKWYKDYQNFDSSYCNYVLNAKLPLDKQALDDLILKLKDFFNLLPSREEKIINAASMSSFSSGKPPSLINLTVSEKFFCRA